MKSYLLLLSIFIGQHLFAQDTLSNKQYIFPEFSYGVVYYKEGAAVKHQEMNYNLIMDEMQFVNNKNKKEAVTDFEEIEYVGIGLRRFLPMDNDFGEIIVDNDEVSLVLKRYTKIEKIEGIGKITGWFGSRGKLNKLLDNKEQLPEQYKLVIDSAYYLIRLKKPEGIKKGIFKGLALSQDRVVSTNYAGFTKIFSHFKAQVDDFIIKENIDFSKSADVIKLTEYCNNLR